MSILLIMMDSISVSPCVFLQERDLCALSSDIFNVYERGVRNVPWCTELWLGYVRAAERHERSHHTVKGTLSPHFTLNKSWHEPLDFKDCNVFNLTLEIMI